MPTWLRIAVALFVLGLVAYAGMLLVGREPASAPVVARKSERAKDPAPDVRKSGPRAPVGPQRAVDGSPSTEGGGAPEPISPQTAKAELTELVDEIETMVDRGETVSQERFVELYKRGTELAQTLGRTTPTGDAAAQKEFQELHTRFRVGVMKIQSRG